MSDQTEKAEEKDPLYVAVRFHGETIVGEVIEENGKFKEDDAGATLTRMHRILEVPLPERSSLGQIKVTTQTAVLPIIPTMGLDTENKVYVSFAGSMWRTVMTKGQFNDLMESITPVEKGSSLSPGDLANLGTRRRQ